MFFSVVRPYFSWLTLSVRDVNKGNHDSEISRNFRKLSSWN